MKEQNKLVKWIKEHKKELILAGVSIGTLILVVLGIKNRDQIQKLSKQLKDLIQPAAIKVTKEFAAAVAKPKAEIPAEIVQTLAATAETLADAVQEPEIADAVCEVIAISPQFVSKHLRNLHEGWNASPEKIATAAENGFNLIGNQTWVTSYSKGGNVI